MRKCAAARGRINNQIMGVIGLIDMTAFFCKPFGLMLGCLIDTLKFSQRVCKENNQIMFLPR